MFTVVAEKTFKSLLPKVGFWSSHISAETAIAHAEARARFENETYVVLYAGRLIYTTER